MDIKTNTSPHHQTSSFLYPLSLIWLIRLVVSWHRYSCTIKMKEGHDLICTNVRIATILVITSLGWKYMLIHQKEKELNKCRWSWKAVDWNITQKGELTISASTNDCPRIPNVCHQQTITYKNSRGSSRPCISIVAGISFQKFWIRMSVSFSCTRILQGFSLQYSKIAFFIVFCFKTMANKGTCNTNSRLGITKELWVLD